MATAAPAAWSWPAATLLLGGPLTLTLQACRALRRGRSDTHRSTDNDVDDDGRRAADLIHLAALPLALYITYTCTDTYFYPQQDFVIFNTVIQLTKVWACLRSIELAATSLPHTWIGLEQAYRMTSAPSEERLQQVHKPRLQKSLSNGANDSSREPAIDAERKSMPRGVLQTLSYAWSDVCSLRGIGWSWGIAARAIPPPLEAQHFLRDQLKTIARGHVLTLIGVGIPIYARQQGSVDALIIDPLRAFGFSALIDHLGPRALSAISNTIHVLAFGLAIYITLEMGYAMLTVLMLTVTSLLRCVLPRGIAPAEFDRLAYPRLMQRPYVSTSLHEFWGKRWHALFRRQFLICGYVPAVKICRLLRLPVTAQRAAGIMGAFAASGVLHESFNHATPWTPRDPKYRTFTFFFLQSFGLVAEAAFTRITGRRVSGILGWLWTFTFLLYFGRMMGDCWMERGLGDFAPQIAEWEWWRWVVPLGFILPRLH